MVTLEMGSNGRLKENGGDLKWRMMENGDEE